MGPLIGPTKPAYIKLLTLYEIYGIYDHSNLYQKYPFDIYRVEWVVVKNHSLTIVIIGG
jgi:hypothetical protein